MSEQKKPPKSRVFFVGMKLLHKPGNKPLQEKNSFFHTYYKWVLWLSLSLYFFTSYLITTNPNTAPTSPNTSSHVSNSESHAVPRAVIDSTTNSLGVLKNLKMFVYELPPKFNTGWLANKRCSNHLFASEVAIHRALLTSEVRTFDPYEADFFFVPVYVSCNFSAVNGFPAIGHARSIISSAVNLVSTEYPFWNRSKGRDHVFVASHDFGACFHSLEDAAIANGIPQILKNSIVLQTFGVVHRHPCQDVENVVIPPYVSPESVRSTLENFPVNGPREIWVFFRGKMELHPKNISGRFYSRRVRTEIWRKFNGDRRFYLQRHRFSGYQLEIARSVFCLCPLGWAPWSPRLVESVALGCVPVIIADGIRLPFSSTVRWSEISLTVAERDVGKLGKILERVAATNLSDIQRNLWDPRTRQALLFNEEMEYGDATWQVLVSLSEKLHRSHRRSSASDESESDT
ncbi:probable glucuronoxylan glucuronosyltransferase IRX7 isoform X2 [Vigna unguiculata]|uniref:Glucuronyl/N-acetylglucosaminyl transferase EXT1 n=1 Tax=Vigna unguiculata TaxID=3917 RepID=A0A4D6N903_VIGUN|nr:probable glucuronoxylan glucuronosyltransferase IRX7 isoform X2 [Vigna unguiculata]QCE09382.1 glucuronyl/N-acetylglucosaminyl transferase EXT1 [Vigna unguiculata]